MLDTGKLGFETTHQIGSFAGANGGRSRVKIYSVKNADGSLPLFDPMQGINADVRASNVPVDVAQYLSVKSLINDGGNAFNRSYRWRDSTNTQRQVYIGQDRVGGLISAEFSPNGSEYFIFSGTNTYDTPIIQAVWNEFITLDLAIIIFGAVEAVIINDDTPGLVRNRQSRAISGLSDTSNFRTNFDMRRIFDLIPDGTRTQLSVGQLQELTTLALALPARGGNTSTGWQLTPPDDPNNHGITELELTLADEFHGFAHPSGEPIIVGVGLPRDYVADAPAPSWRNLTGGAWQWQSGAQIGLVA